MRHGSVRRKTGIAHVVAEGLDELEPASDCDNFCHCCDDCGERQCEALAACGPDPPPIPPVKLAAAFRAA